jgi:hypothetical protein
VIAVLVFLALAAWAARLTLPINADATPASIVNLLVFPVRRGAAGKAVAGNIGKAANTPPAAVGNGGGTVAVKAGILFATGGGAASDDALAAGSARRELALGGVAGGRKTGDSIVVDNFVGGGVETAATLGALA